jgi:soluble lytic murein transglycosylase-like protein
MTCEVGLPTIYLMLLLNFFEPGLVQPERLTQQGIARAVSYHASVTAASERWDVPQWVLMGVLYAETNALPIVSKSGKDWGVMQVRCRVWLRHLKKESLISSCEDLRDPHNGIMAGGYVLAHVRSVSRNKSWPHVLTLYRHGYTRKSVNKGYFSRVYWYGKMIMSHNANRQTPWCRI